MKAQKRNRFWQLHSLLGITLGLPLFIIFVAGTFAFFEPEAINWTHPEFSPPPASHPSLNATLNSLKETHPEAQDLIFQFASPSHPVTNIFGKENDEAFHLWLDPHTGETLPALPHDADFFHFLIDLHFFEFIPFGRELTGLLAGLFFALILTGLVYQWRSFRKDLHLRKLSLEKPNRWKNIHRFTSALTFPFQFIFAITGATLALGLLLAAPAITLFFDGDPAKLNETIFPARTTAAAPSDLSIPLADYPLDQALALASQKWPEQISPEFLMINEKVGAVSDSPATIVIQGSTNRLKFLGQYALTLDPDLKILHDQTPTSHLAPALLEGLVNVHFGSFQSTAVKIIFAFLGLIVSASIASGILILLKRRQETLPHSKLTRLLTTLSHWIVAGLPLALALGLLATQWIPNYPIHIFAGTLGFVLLDSLVRKNPLPRLILLSGIAFALAPFAFLTTHRQFPFPLGSEHDHFIALFNLSFLLLAAGFFVIRKKLPASPG